MMTWWIAAALGGVGVGPSPAGLPEALAPRRVALVVGLDNYDDNPAVPSLSYAEADARAMAKLFQGEGYEVSVVAGATDRDAFWSTWSEVTAPLQHHDLFVLYFAGHAELVESAPAARHPLDLLFSDGTRASLDELGDAVRQLPPLHRVVLLDTCYSQRTAAWLGRQRGTVEVARPSIGRFDAWLFAAAPKQAAQEDAALGHGVFTHYLLEALGGAGDVDGDGQVGVLEAYTWSGHRTAEHTGGAQVPSLRTDRVGWADLPLTGTAAPPQFGILPWDVFDVFIDGTARGPGPVEPGRHQVEVRADGELLARRGVMVREGKVLRTSDWVARSAPFGAVGMGAAVVESNGRIPPGEGRVLARWAFRRGHLRPVIDGVGTASAGALGEASGPVLSGEVRGGLLAALGPIEIGPSLGLGAAARRPPGGWQGAPQLSLGGIGHVRSGAWLVGLDGGAALLPVDGRVTAHPRLGGWLGWTFGPG